jgi:hypothetical protein
MIKDPDWPPRTGLEATYNNLYDFKVKLAKIMNWDWDPLRNILRHFISRIS